MAVKETEDYMRETFGEKCVRFTEGRSSVRFKTSCVSGSAGTFEERGNDSASYE